MPHDNFFFFPFMSISIKISFSRYIILPNKCNCYEWLWQRYGLQPSKPACFIYSIRSTIFVFPNMSFWFSLWPRFISISLTVFCASLGWMHFSGIMIAVIDNAVAKYLKNKCYPHFYYASVLKCCRFRFLSFFRSLFLFVASLIWFIVVLVK